MRAIRVSLTSPGWVTSDYLALKSQSELISCGNPLESWQSRNVRFAWDYENEWQWTTQGPIRSHVVRSRMAMLVKKVKFLNYSHALSLPRFHPHRPLRTQRSWILSPLPRVLGQYFYKVHTIGRRSPRQLTVQEIVLSNSLYPPEKIRFHLHNISYRLLFFANITEIRRNIREPDGKDKRKKADRSSTPKNGLVEWPRLTNISLNNHWTCSSSIYELPANPIHRLTIEDTEKPLLGQIREQYSGCARYSGYRIRVIRIRIIPKCIDCDGTGASLYAAGTTRVLNASGCRYARRSLLVNATAWSGRCQPFALNAFQSSHNGFFQRREKEGECPAPNTTVGGFTYITYTLWVSRPFIRWMRQLYSTSTNVWNGKRHD